MTLDVLRRMFVVTGFCAAAQLGLGGPTVAQAQRNQGRQEEQKDARQQKEREKDKDKDKDKEAQRRHAGGKQDQRRADEERQELIRQHQQRLPEYREVLGQQQRAAEQRAAQLQQQQQSNVQGRERYDYDRDPFFSTRAQYRYRRGDRSYETTRYGLDLLRQAVNYGYFGFYVDRDDYNFYFREGFRRGYEDGYGRRYKYGRVSNGKVAILAGVLAGIITYELIR